MEKFCAVIVESDISLPSDAKKYADLKGWIRWCLLENGINTVMHYHSGCGVPLSKAAADFAVQSGKKFVFIATENAPYIELPDLRKMLTSCRYSPLPALALDVTQRHIAGIAISAKALSLLPLENNIETLAGTLPSHQTFSVQCHVVKNAYDLYQFTVFAKNKIIESLLSLGVFLYSSDGLIISPNVRIGKNTLIMPGTVLLGETVIGDDCIIGPYSTLENTTIGDRVTFKSSYACDSTVGNDCTVGPYSNLRPKSNIADGVKIGDFVEIKNSFIGKNTRIAHLTYVGDSDVGEKVNFGCGVVTVNYDGHSKYRTTIKDNTFIGCNTNLIAPVTVNENSYIAAGSTITEDVPAGALAIARERQINKNDWKDKKASKEKEHK